MTTDTAIAEDNPELVITREFAAPRELVYRAWTRPEMAARWYAPHGFALELCEMDVRVGGRYRQVMRSPDGTRHAKQGVYRTVQPPERLVFTFAWEDEAGRPKHEMLVELRLEEIGERTRLTLRQTQFESATARDLHGGGWNSCLDGLAEVLASEKTATS